MIPLWQRLVGGITGVGAGVALLSTLSGDDRGIGYVPLFFLAAAAIAIHFRRLGAQLFARGAWWSNFGLGVFISIAGTAREVGTGLAMAVATSIPLLLVGQKGLGEASERDGFTPAAYGTTFMLLMILVLADAQSMGLFAFAVKLDHQATKDMWVLVAGTVSMLVAFVGLYRITLWGVITSLVASLGMAVWQSITHSLDTNLARFVITISIFQVFVAAPMLFALSTKSKLPSLPRALKMNVSRAVIVGLVACTALRFATHGSL